ncbi:MAG: hypothetical protein AAF447_13370 [Myxococcota bacterium]
MRAHRAGALLACLAAAPAAAQDPERAIENVPALHAACREAEGPGRRRLYALDVDAYALEGYDEAFGGVPVDTRRNLPALRGAAVLFPAGLEPMVFRGSEERAQAVRAAAAAGARLRVGFFLRFDGRGRPCLLRAAVSVSTVRVDLAYLELVDDAGRVLAREDTERLRAWRDDVRLDGLADGPPAALRVLEGPGRADLETLPVRVALSACRPAGARPGPLVLRYRLEGGRVTDVRPALDATGDAAVAACVAAALRGRTARGVGAGRAVVRFASRP